MSLTVVYEARRFKIPVTPGTVLGQVRQQVCASLKLEPEEAYALVHRGKPVALATPFRLSGLVNNAQLDLVRAGAPPMAGKDAMVRIKIRVPGSRDVTGTYRGDTPVREVLASHQLNGELFLDSTAVASDKQLFALGGSGLLFTFRPASGTGPGKALSSGPTQVSGKIQAPGPVTQAPEQAPLGPSAHSQPASSAHAAPTAGTPTLSQFGHHSENSNPHPEPEVFLPESGAQDATPSRAEAPRDVRVINRPAAAAAELDGPPDEPTPTQFLSYYNHLKAQAEPPLLSRQTREALAASQRAAIEATTCRIKFPDQTLLEGKFRAGETGRDVFEFLSLYLRNPTGPYELVSMMPSFVLTADMLLTTQLGARALLLFRPTGPAQPPFLNDKAARLLAAAPPAAPASPLAPQAPPAPEVASAGPKSKKKGFPKWLKLHK